MDLKSKMSGERYGELLTLFSDLYEKEGLDPVLGCICDAISLAWSAPEDRLRVAAPGQARANAVETYQQHVVAEYLFRDALRRLRSEFPTQEPSPTQ